MRSVGGPRADFRQVPDALGNVGNLAGLGDVRDGALVRDVLFKNRRRRAIEPGENRYQLPAAKRLAHLESSRLGAQARRNRAVSKCRNARSLRQGILFALEEQAVFVRDSAGTVLALR